jgi:hypothetical protein
MIWIAPSEKDPDNEALEKRLWAAADQLRANSGLTSHDPSDYPHAMQVMVKQLDRAEDLIQG